MKPLPATWCFLTLLLLLSCGTRMELMEITLGGERFQVEVARTPEQQQRGLMFRRTLGDREGMLFVYETDARLSFWMKNTPLPLSLAFISGRGEILEMVDLQPYSLKAVRSKRSARYALEVSQGVFAELGVRIGDPITFPPGFK